MLLAQRNAPFPAKSKLQFIKFVFLNAEEHKGERKGTLRKEIERGNFTQVLCKSQLLTVNLLAIQQHPHSFSLCMLWENG